MIAPINSSHKGKNKKHILPSCFDCNHPSSLKRGEFFVNEINQPVKDGMTNCSARLKKIINNKRNIILLYMEKNTASLQFQ